MTVSALHANAFYEQAAKGGFLYTFWHEAGFLVFPVGGNEVIPFWSSRSRIERVQIEHPKYANYSVSEIPIADFLTRMLARFEKEGYRVGVNWSGKNFVGHDVSVADIKRNIGHYLHKAINEA